MLGKTVSELLDTMTLDEYYGWVAHNQREQDLIERERLAQEAAQLAKKHRM